MKKSIAVAAMLGLVMSMPAGADIIGFTDGFAPGSWTTVTTGTLLPPGGSLGSVPTFNATTLTIVGGNGISPDPLNLVPDCIGATYGLLGPCQINVIRTPIAPSTTFMFHWAYTTADSGGPAGDIFGMLVDGTRTVLSDPGGPISQSGNVIAHAVTSFGWFVNCTDCIEGAATATISNFVVPVVVPEPASSALLGLALATLYGVRRRVA